MKVFTCACLALYFLTLMKSQVASEETTTSSNVSSDEKDEDASRIKRQHVNGHNPIGGIIGALLNKKLGLIGSLSSVSSSSSSKGNSDNHHSYDYPSYQPKPFDWWTFKKAILASLLQAVKAITGGVIALNGQLVKVKGHLLAAKGHLLSTKGDAISAFGRHLATHAFSQHEPHHDTHDSPAIAAPSAPAASAPASSGFPGSAPGFGVTGPSSSYTASLVPGFNPDYTSAVEVPSGYYGGAGGYSKRAASQQAKGQNKDAPDGFHAGLYLVKPVQEPTAGQKISVQRSDNAAAASEYSGAVSQFESDPESVENSRLSFKLYHPYLHA